MATKFKSRARRSRGFGSPTTEAPPCSSGLEYNVMTHLGCAALRSRAPASVTRWVSRHYPPPGWKLSLLTQRFQTSWRSEVTLAWACMWPRACGSRGADRQGP